MCPFNPLRNVVILIRPPMEDFLFRMPNPPLGLAALAAYLEKNGFETIIIDLARLNILKETLIDYISKKNTLMLGITALTPYYVEMKKLSRYLKSQFKDIPLVLGGVHVSSLPEISLDECEADVVVIGEGEITLYELVQVFQSGWTSGMDLSKINGIAYKDLDGKIQTTRERENIKNLDELPLPAWDKVNPNKYPRQSGGFLLKHVKFAQVNTTRGCNHQCDYCASTRFWGKGIRARSAKHVVDEIQFLHDKFGIMEIHFWDDNLTYSRKHITSICKEIIRRGLNNMSFSTPNGLRIDTLDEKILKLMKIAGFYNLTFSIESGSRTTLLSANKRTSLSKIVKNARIANDFGFILSQFYMIGFPDESEEEIKKTIRFAKSFPYGIRFFFIMKPLPGSQVFREWVEKRNLNVRDIKWENFNYYSPDFSISEIPPRRLLKLQERALSETSWTLQNLIHFIWTRFVVYFHFSQMKFFIQRFLWFFFGWQIV